MNTKEIKITVPEGYEIDKENSTFECIKFKKKGLTYEDVAEKLFKGKTVYFIKTDAQISTYVLPDSVLNHANNATSGKQLKRLLAINKLMNVAEYLNEDWKPDWKNTNHSKWFISWDNRRNKFELGYRNAYIDGIAYFKTPDLALQAIEILGEEEVKLALGV